MPTPEEFKAEFARILLMTGYRWVFKQLIISLDIENKLIVIESSPPFLNKGHLHVEISPPLDLELPKKKEKPPMTFKFLP